MGLIRVPQPFAQSRASKSSHMPASYKSSVPPWWHDTKKKWSRRWDSNPRVLSQRTYKARPFDRSGTSAYTFLHRERVSSPRAHDRNATQPSRITAGPHRGSVVEWLMAPGCKPGSRRRYAGSNPARPTMASKRASLPGTRAAVSVPHKIERGRCIMVMPLPSKQESRVRFPPPAPDSKRLIVNFSVSITPQE